MPPYQSSVMPLFRRSKTPLVSPMCLESISLYLYEPTAMQSPNEMNLFIEITSVLDAKQTTGNQFGFEQGAQW